MHKLLVSFIVLSLCALCLGQSQVTVNSGYASNLAENGGQLVPFVPLVTTPSISFATVFPSPMGASNGTGYNVVGASNATMSMPSAPLYTVPVWYGSSQVVNLAQPGAAVAPNNGTTQGSAGGDRVVVSLNLGSGAFSEPDVAEAARLARANRTQPVRVFTNADLERNK